MDPNPTNHGGLRGLRDAIGVLCDADETGVLGIVIATEGSTYQKPGALVLLDRHGLRNGVISGGCLEPELERRAAEVFSSGRAALVDFDTRSDEDLVFGSGIGCRGRVQLLLLPLPPGAPLARALWDMPLWSYSLDLSLVVDGAHTGAGRATHLAFDFGGRPQSSDYVTCWDASGTKVDDVPAGSINVRVAPPPQLLLLGAGPETPALTDFARRLGWWVTVVEHRGRWSAFARRAAPDELIEIAPSLAGEVLQRRIADAVIVMTHNFAIDLQHLRFCADSRIGYVGLLGPPARRDALLAELAADADALRGRLHAPVGLDLGGSGPEAIALAIAAELQQFFAARHGR